MLSVEEINRLESENKMLRDSLSLANNIVNKYHAIIQEIKEITENGLVPLANGCGRGLEYIEQILQVINGMDGDSNGNI